MKFWPAAAPEAVDRSERNLRRPRIRRFPGQILGLLALFPGIALLGLLWPLWGALSLAVLGLGTGGVVLWLLRFRPVLARPDPQALSEKEHLQQKTRSLEILYDIAATINSAHDLDDLLTRTLRKLMGVLGARAATIRLLDEQGQMRLFKTLQVEGDDLDLANLPQLGGGLAAIIARPSDEVEYGGMVGVPLHYKHKNLGVFNLYTETPELVERQDLQSLLISVGKHLGGAIVRMRLEAEARKLGIMHERNRIASELHDSLAQTQASLRFRVRMLDASLQAGGGAQAMHDLEQIEAALDQAHTELRTLIAHFRSPLETEAVAGEHFDLAGAIEQMTRSFREATGILTVFHQQGDCTMLPPTVGGEVLRIVQEALANIRKHSQAQTVRVMLIAVQEPHPWRLLVEDDGIGIGDVPTQAGPGEHLGLSIMRERAQRINAELRVESEPGEGTRIELLFAGS